MSDEFTKAARAEAIRTYSHIRFSPLRAGLESGYMRGVRWARTHLAAQEADDFTEAAEPEPAWHKARAVVAGCKHDAPDQGRGTFINDRRGYWLDESGKRYVSADLTDVTPLIPTEVTDEMVDAAYAYAPSLFHTKDTARRVLTAALGLENR